MLRTWLTERFLLAVPVVSAPMAGAAGGALAGAVSAAGGLGMIGVGDSTAPGWVSAQAAIAAASGRAFGIGLLGWARPDRNGQLAAVLDLPLPPALVSVSFGDAPGVQRKLAATLHRAGIVTATQVGSSDDVRRAVDDGFDLLVARGSEGGGHGRDAVSTLPLLQEVLDMTGAAEVPVLAAGGIGTARGVAAVLSAGACGAWIGTAFLTATESLAPPAAKARLLAAASTDTLYTHAFDRGQLLGWPAEFGGRALQNRFTERWPGDATALAADGPARAELRAAIERADYDLAGIYAGQAIGLVRTSRGRNAATAVVRHPRGAVASRDRPRVKRCRIAPRRAVARRAWRR